MKMRVMQIVAGVALGAMLLGACATSDRLSRVPQQAPVVVAAPQPTTEPASRVPEWVTKGTTLGDDGHLVIVQFADKEWTSQEAAKLAAQAQARKELCMLVAKEARGQVGSRAGLRAHPVLGDKNADKEEALSLEERFFGEGYEVGYRCNPPPALVRDWWQDPAGVARGTPGTYVQLEVPGRRMVAFYRSTAEAMATRLTQLKTQRSLGDETEKRLQQMIDEIQQRMQQWAQPPAEAKLQ